MPRAERARGVGGVGGVAPSPGEEFYKSLLKKDILVIHLDDLIVIKVAGGSYLLTKLTLSFTFLCYFSRRMNDRI